MARVIFIKIDDEWPLSIINNDANNLQGIVGSSILPVQSNNHHLPLPFQISFSSLYSASLFLPSYSLLTHPLILSRLLFPLPPPHSLYFSQ